MEKDIKANVFHLEYDTNAEKIGDYGFAKVQPTQSIPRNVLSFNERSFIQAKTEYWLDFFIDDHLFECLWRNCDKYIPKLKEFEGIVGTDYSVYRDMPKYWRIYNCGRNRATTYYLQNNGIDVVPVVSWAYLEDFDWCLDGLPQKSSLAISTNGCMRNFVSHQVLIDGVKILQKQLNPNHLIICGGPIKELLYDNIVYYPNFSQRMSRRIKNGK